MLMESCLSDKIKGFYLELHFLWGLFQLLPGFKYKLFYVFDSTAISRSKLWILFLQNIYASLAVFLNRERSWQYTVTILKLPDTLKI